MSRIVNRIKHMFSNINRVSRWKADTMYNVGSHVRYHGMIYCAVVDHMSVAMDPPSATATNWSVVNRNEHDHAHMANVGTTGATTRATGATGATTTRAHANMTDTTTEGTM